MPDSLTVSKATRMPPLPRAYLNYVGHKLINFIEALRGLGAFLLITVGVAVTKFGKARHVVHPLINAQVYRAGVKLLPMVTFLAFAIGLVVIGQTFFLLNRFGVERYAGTVMVTVVVRELGPILAALLVLARVGTANVVELGTARALGEVEALDALGIDPIHYLVVPRVIGLALAIFGLSIYLILIGLVSGYLFVFLQDVPLLPVDYINQLAGALVWQDFALIALKTVCFGTLIGVVTCYEGLAQPLRLDDVARATTRAVARCVIAAVFLDAVFIVIYLLGGTWLK